MRKERAVRNFDLASASDFVFCSQINEKKRRRSEDYPASVIRLLEDESISSDLTSIEMDSLLFRIGDFIFREFVTFPQFSQIVGIFKTSNERYLLIVREFKTATFSRVYFSYEISRTNRYRKVFLKNVKYFAKLRAFSKDSKLYIHKTVHFTEDCNRAEDFSF